MRIQETNPAARRIAAGGVDGAAPPLRTDARRNLRHVLSAARDVFGEQGYDAPIEEVARRARVGVGTVYRRFPNKDALVQYIAEEETRRLTDRALAALAGDEEPWRALEGFIRFSAASGTSRLLPELFAASAAPPVDAGGPAGGTSPAPQAEERVPQPRVPLDGPAGAPEDAGPSGEVPPGAARTRELLLAMGRLVERTRNAGQVRADVTVADVMLVIAAVPPSLTDPARQVAVSSRLLDLLLQGLRAPRR